MFILLKKVIKAKDTQRMAPTKKAYKGCRDFFPADMRLRNYLFSRMEKVAQLYGYEPYDGPLLEEVELYRAKSGEELINDQIYSFVDRGKREVAIRPEMTPTVARMVANIHKQTAKPLRWYSIPNLMRYEKPQRGRVREHWQYNVDIFGAPTNMGELELLHLIVHFLTSFGATKEMFSILLNDRRVVDSVFKILLKLDDSSSYRLYKVIDKAKKITPEKLDTMIEEILPNKDQKEFFKTYLTLNSFNDLKTFLEKHNLTESCQEFYDFMNLLEQTSAYKFIQYDPTIVRGLDYYTGIVFEIFDKHPTNNRAIAGGGAFANLLQIFNEAPLAGVGFGLGDVTLKDFLETHKLLEDFSHAENNLMIFYTAKENELKAIKLAEELREQGLKIEAHLGQIKFNKIIKTAENRGHKFIGIIEEKDNKVQIQIKDLKNRDQKYFELDDFAAMENFIK